MKRGFDFAHAAGSLMSVKIRGSRCSGRCVALHRIDISHPTRLPLQIPRQRLEIDIPSGENNSDSPPSDIDLPFLNRGVRNGR
jgi:hypothetical protein